MLYYAAAGAALAVVLANGAACAEPPLSFTKDIAPVFESRCAVCHLTGEEVGGLVLLPDRTLATTVGIAAQEASGHLRIKPGDPDGSYLLAKIEGRHIAQGGSGGRMPFANAPLSAAEIAMVRTWIAQGARP